MVPEPRKSMQEGRKSMAEGRKSMSDAKRSPGPAYKDHHFRSNANTGPRSTPLIPNGGLWSVYAECTINTPPKYPYDAIVDINHWREWNTFVPDVLVTKHPHTHSQNLKMEQGTFMTFTVQMTPSERTTSKEVCQHLEPLKHKDDGHKSHAKGGNVTRIRWCLDNANLLTPGFVMKTERVNEIEEMDDGRTMYRTWITFAGMGAKYVRKKYEDALKARVEDFCRDLKERSEKVYGEEKGGAGGGAMNGNG